MGRRIFHERKGFRIGNGARRLGKKRRVSVGLSAERTRQTVVATPAVYGGSTATQLPGPSTLTRAPAMPV